MSENYTFDQALRLVIGRRAPDRERIYRAYVRQGERYHRYMMQRGDGEVALDDIAPLSDKQLAAVIQRHRSNGFSKVQLDSFRSDFSRWEPSIRRTRATKAAAARWGKEKALREPVKVKKSIKHARKLR